LDEGKVIYRKPKKGAWANIPPKSNRNDPICFSAYLPGAQSWQAL
jgi:hypothetical protein